jgi:hypothetical protein
MSKSADGQENTKFMAGELLCRDGHLLFVTDAKESSGKDDRQGGLGFGWDLNQDQGFVFSEALQGYAPLPPAARISQVTNFAASGSPERIDGHICEPREERVTLETGVTYPLRLMQAADLNLPLQLTSSLATNAYTIRLSKVRLENPRLELFRPPDGFTRYDTPEILFGELLARSESVRRRPGTEEGLSGESQDVRQGHRRGMSQ